MKFALASLAAIASTNMPHMYEAEANTGSDVVISQTSDLRMSFSYKNYKQKLILSSSLYKLFILEIKKCHN